MDEDFDIENVKKENGWDYGQPGTSGTDTGTNLVVHLGEGQLDLSQANRLPKVEDDIKSSEGYNCILSINLASLWQCSACSEQKVQLDTKSETHPDAEKNIATPSVNGYVSTLESTLLHKQDSGIEQNSASTTHATVALLGNALDQQGRVGTGEMTSTPLTFYIINENHFIKSPNNKICSKTDDKHDKSQIMDIPLGDQAQITIPLGDQAEITIPLGDQAAITIPLGDQAAITLGVSSECTSPSQEMDKKGNKTTSASNSLDEEKTFHCPKQNHSKIFNLFNKVERLRQYHERYLEPLFRRHIVKCPDCHKTFQTSINPACCCPDCGREFVHDEKSFCCPESNCGKTFKHKYRLRDHQKRVHVEEIYRCPECNKGFKTGYNLKYHVSIHSFPCTEEECGKTFRRRNQLDNHVKQHHRVQEIFPCPENGYMYKW